MFLFIYSVLYVCFIFLGEVYGNFAFLDEDRTKLLIIDSVKCILLTLVLLFINFCFTNFRIWLCGS